MHVKRSYPFASIRSGAGDPPAKVVHFGYRHPLWRAAVDRCRTAGHRSRRQFACGACWESAIRDDERVVVEFDLDRALVVDPLDVDDIAVERACGGDRVRLTPAELGAAVARLAGRGLTCGQISARLNRDHARIRRLLDALATTSAQEVAA